MIDTHCHIIYGVDDGSRSLEESMKMVEIYLANGFTKTIATSHFDRSRYMVDPDEIREKAAILNAEIAKRGMDFKIYPGHEIQVEPNTVKLINDGSLNKLADSRYVLLELPFMNKALFLKDLIFNIQLEGLVPIIAHAERYAYVKENPDYLLDFIKMGALIQVNYSSIVSSQRTTRTLLERDMVHFLGTDAHQSEWRSPNIKDEKREIIDIIGEDKFKILAEINPQKILDDEYIRSGYDQIKEAKKKKRSIFDFWRKK
ncbi:protein tyrosine phosphatase [Anaerococcus sp. NML200574]|uniref:tyrosine-protein phosphatase n=1 Tax=Anaerococcus sp. NML200574 TaxID=2954486 RepID=UPI00223797E6|nr:CpsB/CapC family capsule biosynthesis tyrosine phosphatase [Anaerococcus sp. NML200574]MCW6677786.1 protein tyrosine phosphatase [Anaerococcus sp. NML200574]